MQSNDRELESLPGVAAAGRDSAVFRAREGIERAAARGGNADAVAVERRGSGVVVISGGSTAAL